MVSYPKKERYDIYDLIAVTKILRQPDGCPWDREQTHKSIRMDFIEEVYEAIEAIDKEDTALLREELGDVLFQVLFHAQIEQEQGNFTFDDICDEVTKKMILRHPHVFEATTVSNMGELLNNWENIKQQSKGQTTCTETLESVAVSLPALMRAQKVGKRAAKVGFDFPDTASTMEKLHSEVNELEAAIASGDAEAMSDELGDVLFSCANMARKLGVNAESVLTAATEKFIRRFKAMEDSLLTEHASLTECTLEQMDAQWDAAKTAEQEV